MSTRSDPPRIAPAQTPRSLRRSAGVPRFASVRAISALILREIATTYGRSPGGYVWAILEPAMAILLMTAIFSAGFRSPPLGTNFAIYYASGMLPFFTFITISVRVAQALNFSRSLLSYPRVTFLDAVMARFLLTLLTQLVVSLIIFTVILSVYDTRTTLVLPRMVMAYAMAASLGLGIGLANAVLTSRYPLWHTIWSVITRPLVLLSGVIFLHDKIPDPYKTWLEWNPLTHVTGEARRAMYYSYTGDYVDYVYPFVVAIVCGAFGMLFLRRYYRDLLEL